jgi:sialic acid synthase SpsE
MTLNLAGHEVGKAFPPKVFVEIGINHEGSLDTAKEMARAAVSAGATFIKHQTHIPDAEMSSESLHAIPGNTEISIYEVMKRCALTRDDEYALAEYVRELGAVFFSTPFSREAVERLESFDVPFYKIGSGECNNYPFVDFVASTGKPVVLSTGMNSMESIRKSVEILERRGVSFALLHTTNLYPTPSKLLRLGGMTQLESEFAVPVGLSDHSKSNAACLAAVGLGASILERHFVDSKDRPGPDVICSMDVAELEQLLDWSIQVFEARGGEKYLTAEEAVTANFAFASVASVKSIRAGEPLTPENIFPVRPSGGEFGPEDYGSLLGKIASCDIPPRIQIKSEMLENDQLSNR